MARVLSVAAGFSWFPRWAVSIPPLFCELVSAGSGTGWFGFVPSYPCRVRWREPFRRRFLARVHADTLGSCVLPPDPVTPVTGVPAPFVPVERPRLRLLMHPFVSNARCVHAFILGSLAGMGLPTPRSARARTPFVAHGDGCGSLQVPWTQGGRLGVSSPPSVRPVFPPPPPPVLSPSRPTVVHHPEPPLDPGGGGEARETVRFPR